MVWVITQYRKCDLFKQGFPYSLTEKGQFHFRQCKTESFLLKGHGELGRNVRHTDWPIQNIIKLALKRQHLHYEGERSDCILCALVIQLVLIRPWDNPAFQKMSVYGGSGCGGGTPWRNMAEIITSATASFWIIELTIALRDAHFLLQR